jgi:hypothetical protein
VWKARKVVTTIAAIKITSPKSTRKTFFWQKRKRKKEKRHHPKVGS